MTDVIVHSLAEQAVIVDVYEGVPYFRAIAIAIAIAKTRGINICRMDDLVHGL